jgi:hypothetical protein
VRGGRLCLLKSPFLLQELMMRLMLDTLLGDDLGAALGRALPHLDRLANGARHRQA